MSRSNISNFQRQNKIDDFVFFSEKMINEISTRPSVKLYLESNKLKLVRFAHIHRSDGSYFAGLDTMLSHSTKPISFKDILHPDSILYKTCLTNINNTYVLDALDEVSKKINDVATHYDVMFIVTDAPREVIIDGKKKMLEKDEKIGILLIELGGCRDYPSVPVLKIMCSMNISPILIYIYLYILKKKRMKKGLLELAGCYHNIGGLCAYDRFGFVENYSLKKPTCFDEANSRTDYATTLPMEVNMNKISLKDLDEVLHKRKRLGNEPLCHGMFKDDRVLKKQYLMIEQRQKEYDNIIQKLINPVGKSEKGNVAKVGKRGVKNTRIKKKAIANNMRKNRTRKNARD
jgi:hypothetical protein